MMKVSNSQATAESPSLSASASSVQSSSQQRTWYWIFLVMLLLSGGGVAWWMVGRSRAPQVPMAFGPAKVELMQLESRQLEDKSSFVGVLEAQQGVVLKPEMDGQVVQIFVASGDQVTAGTAIAKLSPDRNQAEVNTAIANTNVSRAALTNAQAQVRAAQAQYASAVAEVALQEEEIRRIRYLVDQGAETQQRLDVVVRNRDGAIASRNAASEQIQAAKAAVQQAEATLTQAQSQVDVAQSDLSDTLITAPINGVVGDIPIKLGDFVEIGNPLTTIVQNQTLDLSLSVPIEYRDQLRLGLPVEISLFAEDEAIEGRIGFIAPQVNVSTQTVTVKAVFDNTLGLLNDDQRVEAAIVWQRRSGVLVPANAISRLAGQAFVFVASPSTSEETGESQLIAEQRSVTLGPIQGNDYQVLDGLEPGESIVVSGILNLSNGRAIAPAESADQPASQSPQN